MTFPLGAPPPHGMQSVPDPGPPTLREAIEGLNDEIFSAARKEQQAIAWFKSLDPNDKREAAARQDIIKRRAEKDHWRAYLTAYRIHADVHPDLLDLPLGTRCKHGPDCLIGNPNAAARVGRDVGADDGDETPAYRPDPRLPPEREPELPFDNP